MADLKISQLGSIVTVVPATDVLPVVQGGTTYKVTPNQLLGAGGTATLASATITGDLTVDTSTLKVDSTNNRVGIGTATPAVICDVTAIEADIAIFRSTGGGGNDKRLTITSGGDRIILNASNNTNTATAQAYAFQSAGTEVGRINTTGVYVLAGGTTTANGVGVAFPSTQSASSDANCLDDYEEGTWTGTLTGSTTNPTIPVTSTGRYTKVGRVVTVQIQFNNVITTGASGNANITGLPFTNSGSNSSQGSLLSDTGLTFTGSTISFVEYSDTVLQLRQNISNASSINCTHNAGTGRYIQATITYTV